MHELEIPNQTLATNDIWIRTSQDMTKRVGGKGVGVCLGNIGVMFAQNLTLTRNPDMNLSSAEIDATWL